MITPTGQAPAIEFIDRHAKHYYVMPDDILYVEADNIYSKIICKNQVIHVCHPIFLMQELLPDYFIRIHRSFLVNSHSITALYHHTLMMSNGTRLPVPGKKFPWLKECLETLGIPIGPH
ncbi:MAG: LytTR family transcriptional regulator [Lachnospiraceae bacterium]|nr:LytTR family transcriptional regulator [Lachnospiraceae bacterium]